jgi:hypothetical protein
MDKRKIIIERFGVPAEVFDYLDAEARKLAFSEMYDWEFGRFWSDRYGISCLIRCKKKSISFEITDGVLSVGNPSADVLYRGPLTLESAQNAVMVLKMLEDDDRTIP